MTHSTTINYLEFPANNIRASKQFFQNIFNWRFQDYGDQYTAFFSETIDGGFYKSDKHASTKAGSVLVVFYSSNLDLTQKKIVDAGGKICKPVFAFPGGWRFHFTEPSGNEMAVWSDKLPEGVKYQQDDRYDAAPSDIDNRVTL